MDMELIQPCLATNLYRPQALGVEREADASTFHQKVLGRALNCLGSNPNIPVWMFLSTKNLVAFVLSEESQEQEEGGACKREVTMALPISILAGSKRKR